MCIVFFHLHQHGSTPWGIHMSLPPDTLSPLPTPGYFWEIAWTEEPVELVTWSRKFRYHDTLWCCTQEFAYPGKVCLYLHFQGSATSGRFPILFHSLCFGTRLHSDLAVWKREAAAENVVNITTNFLLCTLGTKELTSPPKEEGCLILLLYFARGPSLGSVWLQASRLSLPPLPG